MTALLGCIASNIWRCHCLTKVTNHCRWLHNMPFPSPPGHLSFKRKATRSFDSPDRKNTSHVGRGGRKAFSHFGQSALTARRQAVPKQGGGGDGSGFSLCAEDCLWSRWNRPMGHFTFQLNSQNGMSLPLPTSRIYTPIYVSDNHNYFHCSLRRMFVFFLLLHTSAV